MTDLNVCLTRFEQIRTQIAIAADNAAIACTIAHNAAAAIKEQSANAIQETTLVPTFLGLLAHHSEGAAIRLARLASEANVPPEEYAAALILEHTKPPQDVTIQ